MPTRHRAQKHIIWVWNMKNLEIRFHISQILKNNLKDAHSISVQNGCDTFPNELVWFHIEAKPIWDKIQKHGKNEVICKMWL